MKRVRAAMVATLLCGVATLAWGDAKSVTNFGKWEMLHYTFGPKESRCDIRTPDTDSSSLDPAEVPYLYVIPGETLDYGLDFRVDMGKAGLAGARVAAAAIHYDEKSPQPAYAYPLDPSHFSVAASVDELKMGGTFGVDLPRADGSVQHLSFSLIGFTNAYRKLLRCGGD